ncbi:MAG: winged helix-turn-helix domain-containing protein [Terracidiphilus sp.]
MVARKQTYSDLDDAEGPAAAATGPGRGGDGPAPPATGIDREVGEQACSFAGLRLEADGTLRRGDAVVHLPPKELAALRLLLAHAGKIVSPLQLKHALWGDVHVTADSVPKCMSSLRARLEPDACIQTVYKRGYRFSADIRWDSAATAGTLLRLAIMPFATRYSVPEYLGAAIAEETIARLTGAHPAAVAVLARDSVFNLTLRGLTAQQVGEELKADLVLTGTVQAFFSHYRLRAEMVRVEDGTQIWVEDLLAPQNQSGELESELMRRLAYRLGTGGPGDRSLLQGWGTRFLDDRSQSLEWNKKDVQISAVASDEAGDEDGSRQSEAYETFLRGHHEWQTLHRHRMQDGLQHLLRAVELDPTLIAAKIDLAHLGVSQALLGFMSPDVSAELVHRTAESIPFLTDRAAALLPALGWINFYFDRNLPAALLAFSCSSHLPHDPSITRARTMFAVSRHRFAEAAALLRMAIYTDPFAPWLQNRLAWTLHLNGQAEESVDHIRKSIVLFPNHEGIGLYGSVILAYNGETEQAIEIAQELANRLPHFDLATEVHAYALACAGRGDEARAILERLQWLSRERFLLNSFTPAVHVALGDLDAAIEELRAANELRCPWFFQMLADPRLKPLHGRAEFEQMRSILTSMEAEVEEDLHAEE